MNYAAGASIDTVGRILSCNTFADVAQHVLAPLSEVVGASSAIALHISRSAHRGDYVGQYVHHGRSPEAARAYVDQEIYQNDPNACKTMATVGTMTGSQPRLTHLGLLPVEARRDCYWQFLENFDVGDVVAVEIPVVSLMDQAVMCLAFHRRMDEPEFNGCDRERLWNFSAVAGAAVANIANAEALALSSAMLETYVKLNETIGFVLLDDDLCVRHATHQGLADLGLLTSDGMIASGSDTFGELRAWLLDRDISASNSMLTAVGSAGLEVEARALNMPGGVMRHLLVTQGAQSRNDAARMARDLGLSARESEVAMLVCGGYSNLAIAEMLGIALRTVENHLRSTYAKLAITSRTQLIRKLAALQ